MGGMTGRAGSGPPELSPALAPLLYMRPLVALIERPQWIPGTGGGRHAPGPIPVPIKV